MNKKVKTNLERIKLLLAAGAVSFSLAPLNVQAANNQPLRDMVIDDDDELYDEEYEESKEYVEEAYESLPGYAKELLDDVSLYLGDDSNLVDDWYEECVGSLDGLKISSIYEESIKQMIVETTNENSDLTKQNSISGRFYHEIGTIFYLRYYDEHTYIFEDSKTLFNKELDSLKNTNFYSTYYPDNNEFVYHGPDYLCTSIAFYMVSPQELKENCPETYEYVDGMIRDYCNDFGYTFTEPDLEQKSEETETPAPVVTQPEDPKNPKYDLDYANFYRYLARYFKVVKATMPGYKPTGGENALSEEGARLNADDFYAIKSF